MRRGSQFLSGSVMREIFPLDIYGFSEYNTIMRLWSLHPKYLDTAGLLGAWREGLLAQAVLLDKTRGYKNHPQLTRFKLANDPIASIGVYLTYLWVEGSIRGYRFDSRKIQSEQHLGQIWKDTLVHEHIPTHTYPKLTVGVGQMLYEGGHLFDKLQNRKSQGRVNLPPLALPDPHPLFKVRPGLIETWEKQ